ncbi:hypothetical protein [Chryseobacterium herbae]|uniref:Phage holin family protein n=1 Tax=Chryseobacterium herbae TaxID=2976476 RepID=A0ABT2IYL5_9FLAO|nr:hypothetical protein [Chryseobacterium sp. pc1-10]MCT2563938.1 hypothetical protein [Chryseobacterium sp. pc1-10]
MQQNKIIVEIDGLFDWPYSAHDWIIIVLALAGYIYRMYLWHKTPDVKSPEVKDWIGMAVLVMICTIGLYELAIYKQWPMKIFFLPFAVAIVLSKDLTDWMFLSKEGKKFVINAFKEMISGIIEKFGYIKK